MLKIQRSIDADNVRFRLSGYIEQQHLSELQQLIDDEAAHHIVALDLEEVRLVDRDAIGFLARCEEAGIRLENSAAYIREWIDREKSTPANPPRPKRR